MNSSSMHSPASASASAVPVHEAEARCSVHSIDAHAALAADASPAVLGFKAWNLARMAALGLRVPPAFVLGTGFCSHPERASDATWCDALARLEQACGQRLGDPRRPLLLSVRSGAPVSMPGMMETLLNIGLSDATLPGFIRLSGDPRLAWDAYRRLVAGFGEVVAGIAARHFETDLDTVRGTTSERSLDFAALREVTQRHLQTFAREAGRPFPQDAAVQLREAIAAVLRSWHADKAEAYRQMHGLDDAMGTAVTVQRMVFGNAGGLCGAGVGFTRNPNTGEARPWVDFLFNAQGEDVVSGRRSAQGHEALEAVAPALWSELVAAADTLERQFGDMQDFEFTIEEGTLYLLQTRNGKRTPRAAARIALDLLDAGLIDAPTCLGRTADLDAATLTLRRIATDEDAAPTPLATAASAASGVVVGEIAFGEDFVERRCRAGATLILVRRDAETRDIAALEQTGGLLTQHGARTSHAAVVARQLGKVCLVGCEAMEVDETARCLTLAGKRYTEGDVLTLDGTEGRIYAGAARLVDDVPQDLLQRLAQLRGKATPA